MIEITYTIVEPTYKKRYFNTSKEAEKFIYELKKDNYKKFKDVEEVDKVYFIHYTDKKGNRII